MSSSSSTTRTRGCAREVVHRLYVSTGAKAMVRPPGRFRGAGVEVARDGHAHASAPLRAPARPLDGARQSAAAREHPPRRARRGACRCSDRCCPTACAASPRSISASATCSGWRSSPSACSWASCCTGGWDGRARRPRPGRRLRLDASAARACSRRSRSSAPAAPCCCARCCPRCAPLRDRRRRICLFAGITLALAAGTLGISSSAHSGETAWSSAFTCSRTAASLGEALFQLAHRLVQDVGVGILVVFLLLVGMILLTGASLGGALRATGSGVADTTRMMRALGERRLGHGAEGEAHEQRHCAARLRPATSSPAAPSCSRPTRRATS